MNPNGNNFFEPRGLIRIFFLFCSHLFDACLKHSGPEMFFYHRRSNSVCAGPTTALCIVADFCQQDQHSRVDSNPKPAIQAWTTPSDSIFSPFTPYFDENNPVSGERIQRTNLVGSRIPGQVTPAPGNLDFNSSEEKMDGTRSFNSVSGEDSVFVSISLTVLA